MASYKREPAKGRARFFFRFRGKQHNKTVPVADEREAETILARLVASLDDHGKGVLPLPDGVDVASFFLSGGRVRVSTAEPEAPKIETLGGLLDFYLANPPKRLEPSTLRLHQIHARRLRETLGDKQLLATLDPQKYVNKRAKDKHKGEPIDRVTIQKEARTLRTMWDDVYKANRLAGMIPPNFEAGKLDLPKGRDTHLFMTWDEIEHEIARGEPTEIWENLWLSIDEVRDFLACVSRRTPHRGVIAMLAAAAYTGARRSELCRSRAVDWRLDRGVVRVREKKRRKDVEESFREVSIHPDLMAVMRPWLDAHPAGARAAFCTDDGRPISWNGATHYFRRVTKGTRWEVVRGWHVLRHSFASNLALKNVDQRIIDSWMGHSTNIKLRYQHLRPEAKQAAINLL